MHSDQRVATFGIQGDKKFLSSSSELNMKLSVCRKFETLSSLNMTRVVLSSQLGLHRLHR